MSIRTHSARLGDVQNYGPTSVATPSFPTVGAWVPGLDNWYEYQAEATAVQNAQGAAAKAAWLAANPIPPAATPAPPFATPQATSFSFSSVPAWQWIAGAAALLIFGRK